MLILVLLIFNEWVGLAGCWMYHHRFRIFGGRSSSCSAHRPSDEWKCEEATLILINKRQKVVLICEAQFWSLRQILFEGVNRLQRQ